ncbi:MAG: hypothetical protein B5M48_02410 [Candidatus Omnitrophica bacterium 4484_213]|nr:MAG: hypothetical protein B5M48_02410 [Candidatus Omnitrophica bacterium 4484_213]
MGAIEKLPLIIPVIRHNEVMPCFVGTSGWYYEHWAERFYPADILKSELLPYFSRYFSTVELNNSFYHLPTIQSFKNWYKKTPPDFIFSVKASRTITHYKKLVNIEGSLEVFLSRVILLKEKLGPILYQLPPSLKKDINLLKSFLANLPKTLRQTIEFRDSSWLDKETFSLLSKFNIAHCIISMEGFPLCLETTADFVYIRMHGARYTTSYSEKDLKKWAGYIKDFLQKGLDVYIYFNNDYNAYAIENAKRIKELLNC